MYGECHQNLQEMAGFLSRSYYNSYTFYRGDIDVIIGPTITKMKSKKKLLFFVSSLIKIFIWALGLLVIYWIILKLTGHSPTTEAVLMTAISLIGTITIGLVGFCLKMSFEIGKMKSDLHYTKNMVYVMAKDLKELKKDFNALSNSFNKLSDKISIL